MPQSNLASGIYLVYRGRCGAWYGVARRSRRRGGNDVVYLWTYYMDFETRCGARMINRAEGEVTGVQDILAEAEGEAGLPDPWTHGAMTGRVTESRGRSPASPEGEPMSPPSFTPIFSMSSPLPNIFPAPSFTPHSRITPHPGPVPCS